MNGTVPLMLMLLSMLVLLSQATSVVHPRLYFGAEDLPHMQAKAKGPFFAAVMQQYSDALEHKMNYSAGGVLQDVSKCSGCGWRHQLAASLYVAGYGNVSKWGQIAKQDVYEQITALNPASGNWFAGSERNLEQLIGSYDVLAADGLFNATEAAEVEASFALNAQYMFAAPPHGLGVPGDMASRLMNPAADRLAAVGLIALTFPNQPNASLWLAQALHEFRWMLSNGVMEDGMWHEPTTRYHGRVLAAFIPFAYALRQAGVMDPFNDIPNFKKYVGWYRLVQTPADATMGGCALTPALSDGNWETVWEATLGWAAGAYAETDPTYAAELWAAWERACAPIGIEPSPPAMMASLMFVGCTRAGECGRFTEPFATSVRMPRVRARQSAMLTGYAVLEQPALSSRPYLIMTTSTQRQTEGHEHPDRGSFSLYSHGTPLVVDPGVGWCGYMWFAHVPASRSNGTAYDEGLQLGAWYRGSQAHSMVNFAAEGSDIKPENETWRPAGAFGHEWGMRGAAWVDRSLFTEALDFVDLNVTRAVQASQQPAVRGYHRRVFANRRDDAYLLWDAVDAPAAECAKAMFNLHVLTQLRWPGVVGCAAAAPSRAAGTATRLVCSGLNDMSLDVTVLRPASASARGLLHLEADPLPVQFTGMSGSAGAAPGNGMPSVGGALGSDWNANGGVPPGQEANGGHGAKWAPRTPTWIRINADSADSADSASADSAGAKAKAGAEGAGCKGFLTLLQPRNSTQPAVQIEALDELPGGAVTVQTASSAGGTLYLLGDRPAQDGEPQLRGLAGVVGWSGASPNNLDHAELIQGSLLHAPQSSLRIATSSNVTLTVRATAQEQYVVRVHEPALEPVMVTAVLPWSSPPTQVNVWRGAHVWHVANTSLNSGDWEPVVEFEALPGLDYVVERQCIRSTKAGYNDGQGGWLCNPSHPF
jgi:hypothetical protein